jgi:hypothetical protein
MEVLTAWSAPSRPPFTLAKIVQQMKKVHNFQLILFKEEENAPPPQVGSPFLYFLLESSYFCESGSCAKY